MRYLIFLISEVQRYFSNELFDSVEAQRNSAIIDVARWGGSRGLPPIEIPPMIKNYDNIAYRCLVVVTDNKGAPGPLTNNQGAPSKQPGGP